MSNMVSEKKRKDIPIEDKNGAATFGGIMLNLSFLVFILAVFGRWSNPIQPYIYAAGFLTEGIIALAVGAIINRLNHKIKLQKEQLEIQKLVLKKLTENNAN